MKLSVFTVVALLVFVFGVWANGDAMTQPYAGGILIVTAAGQQNLELSGLDHVIFVMHILLAIRLYLHAWAVDETPNLRDGLARKRLRFRLLEWFLRLLWVAGMAWLPEFCGRVAGLKAAWSGFSAHLYVFAISACVLAWDLVMRSTLLTSSRRDKADLRRNLYVADVVIFASLGTAWLFADIVPQQASGNWAAMFVPAAFVSGCIASAIQILVWVGPIAQAVRASGATREVSTPASGP